MSAAPLVTVIVPARNEERNIARCLRAVLSQDHPADRLEIVVIDGASTDGTAAVARRTLAAHPHASVITNRTATRPSNLNAGLAAAAGDIVCRVDARSVVPEHYVSTCSQVLERSEVAVVGGRQVAQPVDSTARSRGIARALNNRYTTGGARYRTGTSSGPSDTVYLGAFRTADVRAVGGWDERLEVNEDFELNRRMATGGLVWFDDRLDVSYVPRQSLPAVWHQYRSFGRWKVRYWRSTSSRPLPRQWAVLGVGVGGLVLAAIALVRERKMLVVAAASLAIVDHLGAPGACSGLRERAFSVATIATVGTAWMSGIVDELIRPGRVRNSAIGQEAP